MDIAAHLVYARVRPYKGTVTQSVDNDYQLQPTGPTEYILTAGLILYIMNSLALTTATDPTTHWRN